MENSGGKEAGHKNTGLKWAVSGAVIFSWPIVLALFLLIVAPTGGDIFLVLALPVLSSFFIGAIVALFGGVQGIITIVDLRRGRVSPDGNATKRAWISTSVGFAPALTAIGFLILLYAPHHA